MSLLGTPGENNYYDCCSGDPVPGNPRNEFPNEWKTGMFEALATTLAGVFWDVFVLARQLTFFETLFWKTNPIVISAVKGTMTATRVGRQVTWVRKTVLNFATVWRPSSDMASTCPRLERL